MSADQKPDPEALARGLAQAGYSDAADAVRRQARSRRSLADRVAGGKPPMAGGDGKPLDPESEGFLEQLREAQKHGGWHSTPLDGMSGGTGPGRF